MLGNDAVNFFDLLGMLRRRIVTIERRNYVYYVSPTTGGTFEAWTNVRKVTYEPYEPTKENINKAIKLGLKKGFKKWMCEKKQCISSLMDIDETAKKLAEAFMNDPLGTLAAMGLSDLMEISDYGKKIVDALQKGDKVTAAYEAAKLMGNRGPDLAMALVGKLSKAARRKMGNLGDMKDMNAADAIKHRGGGGSQINEIGNYRDMTVGEVASQAARGDKGAGTALKIIKGAKKYKGKYGGK
jgi:hypothetical protein